MTTQGTRRGRGGQSTANEVRGEVNFTSIPTPPLSTNFILPQKSSAAIAITQPTLGDNPIRPRESTEDTESAKQQFTAPPTISAKPAPNQPSADEQPLPPSLDIYANNYIPLWLRAANDSFAKIQICLPLNTINFQAYTTAFAGSTIFNSPSPSIKLPPNSLVVARIKLLNTPEHYGLYFTDRLQNEFAAQRVRLQNLSLYNIPIETDDQVNQLYQISVPGIRESSPCIDLGDFVLVRPLVQHVGGQVESDARAWYDSGARNAGVISPAFSGIEFHGTVWGISNARQVVVLRLDGFIPIAYRRCNATFVQQDSKLQPLMRSLDTTTKILLKSGQNNGEDTWLRAMLFPEPKDEKIQHSLSRGKFDLAWYDDTLNFEQQKAVNSIVTGPYGRVPYLISGPPGTGKTKTVVEATLQLVHSIPHAHLLVCAPSDAAADTLATRLADHLKPKQLFRLNSWTRSFAETPSHLLPFCHIVNDLFWLPEFRTMLSFAVVVTTCRDSALLEQAQLTNSALASLKTNLCSSLFPSITEEVTLAPHWSGLLLDEAAQATEPEALIPLSVITPTHESTKSRGPILVLVGDEYQLGPRLTHQSPVDDGLQVSLFERLFNRKIYSTHPLARSKGLPALKSSMLPMPYPAFGNLIRNYRSHPSILSTSSQLFYHNTLIPETQNLSDLVPTWSTWKSWPVLFRENSSEDRVESILEGNGTGAGGLLNLDEAEIALIYAQSLLSHSIHHNNERTALLPEEVMVMSPFTAQVKHLRDRFRAAGLYAVNIGPLEAFQGLESRVVILCTTRTRVGPETVPERFIAQDRANGLGVIDEPKRFNVAITRAKEGLVVIGSSKCLTCTGDPVWKAFLQFCSRNGCVDDPSGEEFLKQVSLAESLVAPMGSLERALKYGEMAESLAVNGTGMNDSRPKKLLRGWLPTEDEEMWMNGMQVEDGDGPSEDEEVLDLLGPLLGDRLQAGVETDFLDLSQKVRVPKGAQTKNSSGQFDRNPAEEAEKEGCGTQ